MKKGEVDDATLSQLEAMLLARGQQDDDDAVCGVCFDGTTYDDNAVVFCDLCNVAIHQRCYGVDKIPEGDFFCDRCLFLKASVMRWRADRKRAALLMREQKRREKEEAEEMEMRKRLGLTAPASAAVNVVQHALVNPAAGGETQQQQVQQQQQQLQLASTSDAAAVVAAAAAASTARREKKMTEWQAQLKVSGPPKDLPCCVLCAIKDGAVKRCRVVDGTSSSAMSDHGRAPLAATGATVTAPAATAPTRWRYRCACSPP